MSLSSLPDDIIGRLLDHLFRQRKLKCFGVLCSTCKRLAYLGTRYLAQHCNGSKREMLNVCYQYKIDDCDDSMFWNRVFPDDELTFTEATWNARHGDVWNKFTPEYFYNVSFEKQETRAIKIRDFPGYDNEKIIEFDKVSINLAYNTWNQFRLLDDVSFVVGPGEKVGIVDFGLRGQSVEVFLDVIFRQCSFEGTIRMHGIDTKDMPLRTLRRNISHVPRFPVLFESSIRRNLDPYKEFSDNEIWDALLFVGLKQLLLSYNFNLHRRIDSGHFVPRRRRLMLMARSILMRNRLLVWQPDVMPYEDYQRLQKMLDHYTDKCAQIILFQTTLGITNGLFAAGCDKIAVYLEGKIVEFGKPKELLDNDQGYFARLSRRDNLQPRPALVDGAQDI